MDLESRVYLFVALGAMIFWVYTRSKRMASRLRPRFADEAWMTGSMDQMDVAEVEVEHCLMEMPEVDHAILGSGDIDDGEPLWVRDLPDPPPSPSDLKNLTPKAKRIGRRKCINRSGCAVAIAHRVRAKLGGIPSTAASNKMMVEKLCVDVLAEYNVRACDVVHVVPLAVVLVFSPTGTDVMAKRLASTREVGERLNQYRAKYGRSALRKILDWVEGEEHLPSLEFGQH